MQKLPVDVNKKRWAMYAAAGAAAVFSGANTAEALDITHVVVPDGAGNAGGTSLTFDLGDNGAVLTLGAPAGYYGGFNAGAGVDNADGSEGGIAGFVAGGFLYGANLASNDNLSTQNFANQNSVYLLYGSGGPNTAFTAGESGFVGFSFDDGEGDNTEFGWALITFDPDPDGSNANSFVVNEFAYSSNGASIVVGQTESAAVPEPTSLGLLALGAFGVLANRRRKSIA